MRFGLGVPRGRSDHADAAGAAVDQEDLGGRGSPADWIGGGERELCQQGSQDLVGGDHVCPPPAVLGVQGHLLDEPELVPVVVVARSLRAAAATR
jgi:hypothetical protein